MFKIPRDIYIELRNEFPEVKNLDKIIDSIFDKIFKKTIRDGSCAIRKLGTFFVYKTISNRINQIVPRFKFLMSKSMRTNLGNDEYLMDQIPDVRIQDADRIALLEKTGGKIGGQDRRDAENNRGLSHKRTQEKIVQDEISAILDTNFDEEEEDE